MVDALLADEFDVLYLVCHGKLDRAWSGGRLVREESLLYLEGPEKEVAATNGTTLVARLTELINPPRLIVLASCQSGGAGDDSLSGEEAHSRRSARSWRRRESPPCSPFRPSFR